MDARTPDDDRQRLARASSLAMSGIEYADVPGDIEARLRSLCTSLPEVVERQAWAGTQWRIRNRMFAHVLAVDFPAGPVTVLTFRSSGVELDALRNAGDPFFRPAWGADVVGMVLDAAANWDEITELVIESYRTLAPRKLVALLDHPPDRHTFGPTER
jgi:YjbR